VIEQRVVDQDSESGMSDLSFLKDDSEEDEKADKKV